MPDPHSITLNHNTYPIIATRRKGTRRFVLRFNAKKQAVALSVPMRASMKEALAFAHTHHHWLAEQIEKHPPRTPLAPGVIIPLLDERILLQHQPGRGLATFKKLPPPARGRAGVGVREIGVGVKEVRVEITSEELTFSDPPPNLPPYRGKEIDAILTIHGDIAFFNRRLKDWLHKHLKAYITALANEKVSTLGVKYTRLSIREADSHWGSCSPTGTLNFALNLVFATPEQVDYIVCHEVAHLRELNHSKRFWKLVEELCPGYERHRRWFKAHGHELGRYLL